MNKLAAAILVFLTLLVGQATAQTELDRLADKLQKVIKTEKPDWKCVTADPTFGAETVKIVACSWSNRTVSVSIQSSRRPRWTQL